jgi:hypothetical protein
MGMGCVRVGVVLLWNVNASVVVAGVVVSGSFLRAAYDGVLEAASC